MNSRRAERVFVLALIVLGCETSNAADASRDVTDAWERATQVKIDPAARALIERAVGEMATRGKLTPAAVTRRIRAYLYALKERIHRGSGDGIDERLVVEFPLESYLQAVGGGRPVGYLACESSPRGERIQIDSFPQGRTYKEFLVSVGRHVVRVNTCERTIEVKEDEVYEIHCP